MMAYNGLPAPIEVSERYNHTFPVQSEPLTATDRKDSDIFCPQIDCPCGTSIAVPRVSQPRAAVIVCPTCQSWHSVLYK